MKDPLQFLLAHSSGSLEVIPLEWDGYPVFLINHPEHVAEALLTRQRGLARSGGPERLAELLGRGLLRSQGELHRRQRRLAQQAFTPTLLASYAGTMRSLAEAHFRELPRERGFDLHARMVRLALAIAARTFFSLDLDDVDVRRLGRVMSRSIESLEKGRHFLSEKLRARRFRIACGTVEGLLFRWIAERRSRPDRSDLLTALVLARDDETGGAMEDRQLRDELMTLFVAGHETTASSISWAAYLLARHPEWQERLAGAEEGEGDRLSRAVFCEALRLYPPAWVLFRRVLEPMTLGGREIPAGAHLALSPYAMGRNPAVFAEPGRFLPERWLSGEPPPPGAFFAFGLGNRRCLGEQFAWSEGTILLLELCRLHRLRLAPGAVVEEYPAFTLRPRRGLPLIASPLPSRPLPGCWEGGESRGFPGPAQ